MRSQTTGHFPQFRFQDGRKWLFNPVLKTRFANRPEERVRLQYVEFLLHQTNVNKNRIGFETPVKAESAENTLRADLVIYDQQMNPFALVECKSGRIKLNAKTAEQTARYNLSIQAEFLMITNGIDDFWFKHDGKSISPLQNLPFDLTDKQSSSINKPDYWISRGFLDASISGESATTATQFLTAVFSKSEGSNYSYLNLPPDILPISLDHYYRIYQVENGYSLALSVVAAASNQTMLAAMLNKKGQNRGILWLPLTDFFENDRPEANRLTPGGQSRVKIPEGAVAQFRNPSNPNVKKLVNHLINLFD